MKYLKTFENIQAGHDIYLIMTDDEKYYLTNRRYKYPWIGTLTLEPVEDLKVEDFSFYGYTGDIERVVNQSNNTSKSVYVINSIIDDSDMFKVIKYDKEKNLSLIKLLKPLKSVPFFFGAYQKDNVNLNL